MPIVRSDEELKRVLKESRTVAVLGASTDPLKPSFSVSIVVRTYGFRMFFVNPNHVGEEILGEQVYASLRNIPVDIDIVDVFRRPSAAREVAEEIRAKGCRIVWFQPGTEDVAVAGELADEGFCVVLGRCMKVECRKLL